MFSEIQHFLKKKVYEHFSEQIELVKGKMIGPVQKSKLQTGKSTICYEKCFGNFAGIWSEINIYLAQHKIKFVQLKYMYYHANVNKSKILLNILSDPNHLAK